MTPFAIGLGANLGAREETLSAALALVDSMPGVELLASSSLYETPPWGDVDQGRFLNAAAVGRTTLAATELLHALQGFEALLGKQVIRKWGPRAIDIDLFFWGRATSNTPELQLPHPRIAERPFAYLPLREALAAAGMPLDFCPDPLPEGIAIEGEAMRLPPRGLFPLSAPPAKEVSIELPNLDTTHALARRLAMLLRSGGTLALDGQLGAGKSELARETLHALGVEGRIPSPTYTLCREYELPALRIQHWDFYRMGDESELESAGFGREAEGPNLVIVEWAERFPRALAIRPIHVRLEVTGDESRRAVIRREPGVPLVLRTFGAGASA